MDGIVFGWTFLAAARAGRLDPLLTIADDAARAAGRPVPSLRIAEIKLYVDRDDAVARHHCRIALAGRIAGLFQRDYTETEYARLGIPLADIERLLDAVQRGLPTAALAELVTDTMLDALCVAGDQVRYREQLTSVRELADKPGFQQLMFSELGADVPTALDLLCNDVLPSFAWGRNML
jgi:hypothetical protein